MENDISIRPATLSDADAVANIYAAIHQAEQSGRITIGWDADFYPVRKTATDAIGRHDLFVMETGGKIIASAIINNLQPEGYSLVHWSIDVPSDRVGVLHTLVVHPDYSHSGYERKFVEYFERTSRQNGWEVARLDTQTKNTTAIKFYPKLGYKSAGTCETTFFTLPQKVTLALFEKQL